MSKLKNLRGETLRLTTFKIFHRTKGHSTLGPSLLVIGFDGLRLVVALTIGVEATRASEVRGIPPVEVFGTVGTFSRVTACVRGTL